MKKCIILALSAFMIACKEAPKPIQQGAKELPVIRVGAQNSTNQLSYPVNIEGTINSPVQARVSGYITQVLVDEGAKVTKGQPLFRLETHALSQTAQAAKSAVDVAQVEVNRLEPLVAKNIVSNVQLETAKANLNKAKASYAETNANLDYAIVRAPVNGVVGSINQREGALVTANNTTLTTVSDIKQVYAYFSMNEKEYLSFLERTKGASLKEKINNLPEVTLRLANGQLYEHKGKIQAITGQIDKTTGSIQFRATFDNPNGLLTNGNSGTLLLPETNTDALVIPEMATYEMQGVVFAFKVESDTIKQVILKLKNRSNNLVVVDSGIESGDLLLVQGLNTARSGMIIKPKEVSMDSIVKSIQPIFR